MTAAEHPRISEVSRWYGFCPPPNTANTNKRCRSIAGHLCLHFTINGKSIVSDGFNPYREWLGLGANSPNHYELLGLPLQESDTATIAGAAERAITRVRSFRPGPLAREWAGLLDEIRAAKECLLNADRRGQYDTDQAQAAAADPILPPESPAETETAALESLPAAIAIPIPLPALPAPMVVAEQPIPPAINTTAQRTIIRTATTLPPKNSRSWGLTVTWGTIIVLCLVVAGLSYRMSEIARQPHLLEAAVAMPESKRAATKPYGNPSSRRQSARNMASPSGTSTAPSVLHQSQQSAMEAATPAPHDVTPIANITRTQVEQLVAFLEAAKIAAVQQDFPSADSQLAKAAALAQLPRHRDAISRLKQVNLLVKQFRQALTTAVAEMQVAETFEVGSTHFIFVEAQPDSVILRTGAKNVTHRLSDMPTELAIALADRKLAADDPMCRVVKGAYLLVNKRSDSRTRAEAETLWSKAQSQGANITHLLPFLNDDYAALLADTAE
jgi:hypothetical protein